MTASATPLELSLSCSGPDADGNVDVRLTVFNPGGEPVVLDRRLLLGPHPGRGDLVLLASEPTAEDEAQERLLLNPLCFYGRQRRYQYPSGTMTFHGYLVREPTDGLLPTGTADPAMAAVVAEPLEVAFD